MGRQQQEPQARRTVRERIAEALRATHSVPDRELDLKHYPDRETARAAAVAERRRAAVAGVRAAGVVEQFAGLLAERAPDRSVTVDGVTFAAVTAVDGGVDVRLGDSPGERHFRIFNPPTLVYDSAGTVQVRGRPHREDPLAALAQVIRGVWR